MKTYKLIYDTLRPVPENTDVVEGLQARPVEALGLYSDSGEFVGVKLPDIALHAPSRRTAEEIEAARQEFILTINALPKLTPPEGKPLDLEKASCGDQIPDDDEFYAILESFRKPEPWINPLDLSM
jgi:hypothetical protein